MGGPSQGELTHPRCAEGGCSALVRLAHHSRHRRFVDTADSSLRAGDDRDPGALVLGKGIADRGSSRLTPNEVSRCRCATSDLGCRSSDAVREGSSCLGGILLSLARSSRQLTARKRQPYAKGWTSCGRPASEVRALSYCPRSGPASVIARKPPIARLPSPFPGPRPIACLPRHERTACT